MGGEVNKLGKLQEVGSHGNDSDDNGEDKEHKGNSEEEKRKTMKKRVQRRKRRLLGSLFMGQAPQKRSLADSP